MNKKLLSDFCTSKNIELSESQLELFDKYEQALYESNKVMNLTRVPAEECTLRHFIDSLLPVDLIPENGRVLDVGCGPGFPAWALACARPDLQVTALDSSSKMTNFLNSQPLPNLRVICMRAEEFPQRERFDFITGRALAPLSIQLEVSAPFCKIDGIIVPFRSVNEIETIHALKLEGLGIKLEKIEERTLPGTDIQRVFPVYRKTKKTAKHFPRSWAKIKQDPLE